IRHPLGGHHCDSPLARGESFDPRENEAPGPCPGRDELGVGALGERLRAAVARELESLAQRLACVRPAIRTPQDRTEVHERFCVLEPCARTGENLDRLAQACLPLPTAPEKPECAQGDADRPGGAPAPGELELLGRERASLLVPAERVE